jgi:autotransporter family porin
MTTMKTKSISRTGRKFSKKVLLIVTALALCASPATALAVDCLGGQANWNVHSGNWFEPGNWDPNHVPDSSNSAQVNNGGTATIGRTGAVSCDLTLGATATQSGTVVLDQGSLDIQFDAAVGEYGKGVLTITNGGTVTAALAAIATLAGGNGAATVDGTNSKWTLGGGLDVGGAANAAGGTGLLTVTNGGTVTAASVHVYNSGTLAGNGTVTMTSPSTPVATIDGTLSPSGTLTINGNLTFTSSAANMRCNVSSSSWDRAEVSGRATLNGKLSVTLNGFFTGDFPLLHASTLLGTFSSYSFTYTGCLAPSIVYDRVNGYVYLHVESTCQ